MSCQSCGTQLPSDTKFCTKCGQQIEQKLEITKSQFCANCGSPLVLTAKFCAKCGIPTDKINSPYTLKDSLSGQSIARKGTHQPQFCTKCRNELHPGDKFCDECGNPVAGKAEKQRSPYPPKPRYSFKDLTERCFLCGLPTPSGIVLCPRCGVRQTCFKCGRPLGPGKTIYHSVCPKCGHKKVKKKVQERITFYRGQLEPNQEQIMAFYS